MGEREELVDHLLLFIPSIFRKLMKQMPDTEIPRQQFKLLHSVCHGEGKTMSDYSEEMNIPKSNISVLADRLIKEGFIMRETDPDDRRVIYLNSTKLGKELFEKQKKRLKKEMLGHLEILEEEDITKLNNHIVEMKRIFDKLI